MSRRNGTDEGLAEPGTERDVEDVASADAEVGTEVGAEEATAGEAPPLVAVIEAVLFASAEPVPLRRLARLLSSWSRAEVEAAVQELRARLEDEERGIRLVEAAGGLQLRSAERLAPWVRRFFAERPPRLSRPVLETLAIIAYRQPVTRGEIEQIRGVNCDAVLGALTARGLIRIQGRRASPGRPAEYGTTDAFLELFTLRDLSELPPLPDPTALANLIAGAGDAEGEDDGGDAPTGGDAAAPEDLEPRGDRLPEGGGGDDPQRPGEGEREGGEGARDASGSGPGPDHR